MKGIVSEGMLASFEEIGFNEKYISTVDLDKLILLDNVDLKSDPIEYFELDDYIIDISILTNRSDANSYFVMAREIAAYFYTKFT
jgi:phenylalanyl-tRNA synthetase beta chain